MKKNKKIIGLTSRYIYKSYQYNAVPKRYIDALNQYDIGLIILPIHSNNIEAVFTLCDAFILTGGDDIEPSYYQEKNISCRDVDQTTDLLDKEIILHALKYNKPLLGICRGIQSINVFLGGTLYQDLQELNKYHNNSHHEVKIQPSRFFSNHEPFIINSNSFHHQAIKELAKDLKVIGTANTIIEAVEHYKNPIYGFQWHPEINLEEDCNHYIFENFINKINNTKLE